MKSTPRPRKRTGLKCFSLEPDIAAWIDATAKATRRSRSQLLREILLAEMERRAAPCQKNAQN